MSSVFKIYSPEDCDFYYDGELQGHIEGNSKKAFRFEVERKGVYRLEFINSEYQTELMMKVSIDADEEREVELDFSEVNEPVIQRLIIAIEHDYGWREQRPKELLSIISKNVITIPKGVKKIGNRAFHFCTSLTSITIPDSVTKIGEGAFCACHSLISITLPNSITEIGKSAFSNCHSLISITIPASVNRICDSAFSHCVSLTSITVPNSVTMICDSVFEDCSSLKSIVIPNSVTMICDSAFCGCKSLESITIPDSVIRSIASAFTYCSRLTAFIGRCASNDCRCWIRNSYLQGFAPYNITEYTIPNNVTVICSGTFSGCSDLTSITIPNSVTKIMDFAFSDCLSLTSITIPNGVTDIGEGAFSDCRSLSSVYCKATIPPNISIFDSCYNYNAFDNNAEDLKIYVPKSEGSTVLEAYKSADGWKDYADSIEEYDFDNE